MQSFLILVLLSLIAVTGCAHSPDPVASAAEPVRPIETVQPAAASPTPETPAETALERPAGTESGASDEYGAITDAGAPAGGSGAPDEYGDITDLEQMVGEESIGIADPLEPFNRAMYHFNDKLYFWVLKPVAQGYGKVVPEQARVSVSHFFANLTFPVRFVNCLLQANLKGAATELGRFTINTLWGIGGLLDPAGSKEIDLTEQDEDFGQTLGAYGLGQGFYINWPIFGPSSPRDTVGMIGDGFLRPTSYVSPWYAGAGIRAYDTVNDTSLRIGDYESLKQAAIDPYVAIRDAYVQYRRNKVKQKGGVVPTQDTGVQLK